MGFARYDARTRQMDLVADHRRSRRERISI